ncbi:hypothetical protein THAOC_29484 [Thalassiosira oceanica]|uniref:Leucine-rich repeat domain-containing protein n=1 Tax=Thalassiosira oceanica TaxID=159749 RepID=K0RX96_THAOC|nr:hypothetical protein THAOC_29484 [Thalassiosira oceanica]|eukprot:EJK51347.1 hypothetical protein THAOC_29484 [Thalassiosira oceanica]
MDDDARGSRDERESAPHQLDDELFLYEGGEIPRERRREITRVRIGPQVKDIASGTFAGCRNLAEVHFDEGTNLLAVGDNAFSECVALRQVTIPTSVTRLGTGVFAGCSNLAEVHFDEGTNLLAVGDDAFRYCTALRQVTIPASVTRLGDFAFDGCSNLAEVQFDEGLEIIGGGAFIFARRCEANLSEVILLGGEWLLNEKFLDRGLFCGQGVLNQKRLNAMVGFKNSNIAYHFAFLECPLTAIKVSVPGSLSERMTRLPEECRLSIEGRIRELSCLELAQGGTILACFPVVTRVTDNEIGQYTVDVQDTDNQTAESLHQVLRLISFHELKESSILIELALWKSRLVVDRAHADCRTSVPDPAKSLIMEYCGFTDFLKPVIEGD